MTGRHFERFWRVLVAPTRSSWAPSANLSTLSDETWTAAMNPSLVTKAALPRRLLTQSTTCRTAKVPRVQETIHHGPQTRCFATTGQSRPRPRSAMSKDSISKRVSYGCSAACLSVSPPYLLADWLPIRPSTRRMRFRRRTPIRHSASTRARPPAKSRSRTMVWRRNTTPIRTRTPPRKTSSARSRPPTSSSPTPRSANSMTSSVPPVSIPMPVPALVATHSEAGTRSLASAAGAAASAAASTSRTSSLPLQEAAAAVRSAAAEGGGTRSSRRFLWAITSRFSPAYPSWRRPWALGRRLR